MAKQKKVSRKKSLGAISHDALTLRVAILETLVRELRRDLAPTVALRQNLAEQIRLGRKLRALQVEADKGILESAPPQRSWWQNWWDALFLGAVHQVTRTANNVVNVAEISAKMSEAK